MQLSSTRNEILVTQIRAVLSVSSSQRCKDGERRSLQTSLTRHQMKTSLLTCSHAQNQSKAAAVSKDSNRHPATARTSPHLPKTALDEEA